MTVVDLSSGENCLTITKKILKAYGVNGLPDLDRTPPLSGPNNYRTYAVDGRFLDDLVHTTTITNMR